MRTQIQNIRTPNTVFRTLNNVRSHPRTNNGSLVFVQKNRCGRKIEQLGITLELTITFKHNNYDQISRKMRQKRPKINKILKVKIQTSRYESDKKRSEDRRAKRAGPQNDFQAPAREARRSSEVFLRLIVASKY